MIVNEGQFEILNMALRGDDSALAEGANWYIGLCSNITAVEDTLTEINEPTSAGGYARQPVTRDILGWPGFEFVNGVARFQSDIVSFAASGADFSQAFDRGFLCTSSSGTGGKLIAYSGSLPSSLLIVDGVSYPLRFNFFGV